MYITMTAVSYIYVGMQISDRSKTIFAVAFDWRLAIQFRSVLF